MRSFAIVTILFAIAGVAGAQNLDARLESAAQLLEEGQPEAALKAYRELQVDAPDDPAVAFGLGCAHYGVARQHQEAEAAQEADSALGEAIRAFDKAAQPDAILWQPHARFNRANALAKKAELLVVPEQYKEKVAAYRKAAESYETLLEQHPEYEEAEQNLDHVRYKLKKLLQNPPEDQKKDDKNNEDQPQVLSIFNYARTEVPGAEAVPKENTVMLQQPQNTGQNNP